MLALESSRFYSFDRFSLAKNDATRRRRLGPSAQSLVVVVAAAGRRERLLRSVLWGIVDFVPTSHYDTRPTLPSLAVSSLTRARTQQLELGLGHHRLLRATLPGQPSNSDSSRFRRVQPIRSGGALLPVFSPISGLAFLSEQ